MFMRLKPSEATVTNTTPTPTDPLALPVSLWGRLVVPAQLAKADVHGSKQI